MEQLIGGGAAGAAIVEANSATFEQEVMAASMERPVLVDFWAPWCGPCRQLAPLLERAVQAARGKVRLVKVNTDDNPDLAQALRIQSLPTVYAIFQGRPVDTFQGALPESQIKAFIDRVLKATGADADEQLEQALAQAAQAAASGDADMAGAIYGQIIEAIPDNAAAHAGLAEVMIAKGRPDEARAVLERLPQAANDPAIAAVRARLELAEQLGGGADTAALEARLASDDNDHEARFELAGALFAAGQKEAAINQLMEIVRRDREWNEDAARLQLLKLFEAMGPTDPVTLQGRRKLSSLLFS